MLSLVTLSLALGACHLQNTGFQRKAAAAVGFAYDAIICNILVLMIVISLFLPSPANHAHLVQASNKGAKRLRNLPASSCCSLPET